MAWTDGSKRETSAAPRADTDSFRASYRLTIPAWYNGHAHLASTIACVLLPSLYCLSQLHDVSALELLTIPIQLVLGSLFVWVFHKHVLHRPVPGMRKAYVIHTLTHHRFYTHTHGEPASARDYHITLFPISFGPGLALIALALGHYGVGRISPNVGLLFSMMAVVYFGLYELVHLASHMPDGARVLRLPFLRRLREHHRLHHDPRLMGTKNFNIVLPLFDWLLGSMARERPEPSSMRTSGIRPKRVR